MISVLVRLNGRTDGQTAEHTGWEDLANHVLRVHVPLVVPPGGLCGLWVDGQTAIHNMGEIIIFDDSKLHKAFNNSAADRIVLIIDVLRPPHLPLGAAKGGHTSELDSFISKFK